MNIVEQIFDSVETIAQATLGGTWKKLPKVLKPEDNDLRTIERGFGVRFGAASAAEGVTRVYTMDHVFELVLGRRAVERNDDGEVLETFNDLYAKADDVFRELVLKKAGLPGIVLLIDKPAMDPPQILANEGAILVMSFVIKYRNQINL